MKKTWLFRAIAFSLLLCMILTACAAGGNSGDTTVADTTVEADTTTEEETTTGTPDPSVLSGATVDEGDFPIKNLTVAGNPITYYRIVYARDVGNQIVEDIGALLKNDYELDRISADALAELIHAYTGVRLVTVCDTDETEIGDYEILVGKTNRTETNTFKIKGQAAENFVLKVKGTKPVIVGGEYGATWKALDVLENYFKTCGKTVDLDDKWDLSGTVDLLHIGCVGDSITHGSRALDSSWSSDYGNDTYILYIEKFLSYPAVLKRTLWKNYVVTNYGKGASTMRPGYNDSSNYYKDSTQYQDMLKDSESFPFSLVTIMLGSNDMSRIRTDWTPEIEADYESEAKSLIDAVKEHSPDATFVIMNAPTRWKSNLDTTATDDPSAAKMLRDVQARVAQHLADQGYKIWLYDMGAYTFENVPASMYDKDGLHPNNAGYRKIAEALESIVSGVFDGETVPYLREMKPTPQEK